MIEIAVPGREIYHIEHILLDYNGTIAVDGLIPWELKPLLCRLSKLCPVTVLTADTHGTAKAQCLPLGLGVETFPKEGAAAFKEAFAKKLGGEKVACLGNGYNDIGMFDACRLSVAVLDREGLCCALLPHATLLCPGAKEALELFLKPQRLVADLRT